MSVGSRCYHLVPSFLPPPSERCLCPRYEVTFHPFSSFVLLSTQIFNVAAFNSLVSKFTERGLEVSLLLFDLFLNQYKFLISIYRGEQAWRLCRSWHLAKIMPLRSARIGSELQRLSWWKHPPTALQHSTSKNSSSNSFKFLPARPSLDFEDAVWHQVVSVGGSILGCSCCLLVTLIRIPQCKLAFWQRLV